MPLAKYVFTTKCVKPCVRLGNLTWFSAPIYHTLLVILNLVSVNQDNLEEADSLNVRLCLHGCGLKPQMSVLTSSFAFQRMQEGERITRVIDLRNDGCLPFFVRFEKTPGFDVSPPMVLIPSRKTTQLTLNFRAISLGKYVFLALYIRISVGNLINLLNLTYFIKSPFRTFHVVPTIFSCSFNYCF